MVLDFVQLGRVGEFIHSFDHSYTLWNREPEEIRQAIGCLNRRIAEIPVSPSAEGYALLFFFVIDRIIRQMPFINGEGNVILHAVRVHETLSGYAEAAREDLDMIDFSLSEIIFSEGIMEEWKDKNWWNELQE